MNRLFLLGIGALVIAVITFGVAMFGYRGDATRELVAQRTERVTETRTSAASLQSKGLQAGDPEYDKAARIVERSERELRDAQDMLVFVEKNRTRWLTAASVAMLGGLGLLGLGLTRRSKVALV